MIVNLKAKNILKFGNNNVCEYNRANGSMVFDFSTSRVDRTKGELTFPEVEIPNDVKTIFVEDLSGGVRFKWTVEDFNKLLKDEQYVLPYNELIKTKNVF